MTAGPAHSPRLRLPHAGLAVLALASLQACTSIPLTNSAFTDLNRAVGRYPVGELPALPATRAWPDAGKDARSQRARAFGLVSMPDMQKYLDALYARIKTAAGVPDWPGSVYITARTELDAYCTQAGNMYLSLGWLQSAASEDEIVAVMSHELGHVFSDTHKLEGALVTTDTVAVWSLVAVAIARKTGASTAWSIVDSAAIGYAMARGALAPAWSRGEEEAADRFGATVSLRLGYSYTAGFKAFLERQATWETENAKKQEVLRQQGLTQQKAAVAAGVQSRLAPKGAAQEQLAKVNTDINTAVLDVGEGLSQSMGDLWKQVVNNHPDTQARLDALTPEVSTLIAGKPRPSPTVKPWTTVKEASRTASILKNYQLATDAQEALQRQDIPGARRLAISSASGATALHALPTLQLGWAEAATSQGNANARTLAVLDRNLRSEPDRAWHVYVLRSNALLGAGQTKQARGLMAEGFDYFNDSPYAWPDQITFVAKVDGWDSAKKLAGQCAQKFPSQEAACRTAAQSPSDVALQKSKDEQKSQSLLDKAKWLKK